VKILLLSTDFYFTISKGFSFYNIAYSNNKLTVEAARRQPFQTQSPAIAQSLQLIASLHIARAFSSDVQQVLIEHFEGKGWTVYNP